MGSNKAFTNSQTSAHVIKNSQGRGLISSPVRRAAAALCAAGLLLLWCAVSPAMAATVPAGFSDTVYASGLNAPTAMAFAPDGRLFICQQNGELRVVKNGILLSTPFLTVNVDPSGERGLLGVTFDPNFSTNGFVYVYYTTADFPRHNRVSRFTANGDVALAGSETIILELDNLTAATNHNGGAIHFGPDGKLYIAVGENATPSNSQSLANLLGKVLRINADGTIPADNPFFSQASGKNRAIWALGLRNPFTFAFQTATGRMFINDVGQNTWEEINEGVAGSNYGWPATEGPTTNVSFRGPIFAYQHGSGSTTGCAVTGGTFYNPPTPHFPAAYVGNYFFADLCSGWIRRLDPANNNAVTGFATGVNQPVDLKVGPDGRLYYLARGNNAVFRIQFNAAIKAATTTSVLSSFNPSTVGQSVTFTAKVTSLAQGTPTGTVQFKDNGVNLGTPVALNQDGAATISTSSLSPGTHNITADYSGDNNFEASTGALAHGQIVGDGKLIQFGQTSYQIREDADSTAQHFPSLTIEVKRVGSAAAEATVQYVTRDGAGLIECGQVSGQASYRCDYVPVSGVIRFGVGEITKTITVPIINDGYKESTEFFIIELLNPVGAAVASGAIATIAIEDDPADATPTTPASNPYLNNGFFVRQNYLDFLLREPDAAGFADWTSVLNNCGPQKGFLGAPKNCDRAHVSHGFFGSVEFTNTGFLIHRLYEVGMNRLPRFNEFTEDMGRLRGFGLSEAQQQQNLAEYLQQFTSKQEFINRFQGTLEQSQAALLIQRLEQTAGITLPATATTNPGQPTQYGRQELINLRAGGTFNVGQTLKAFVEQQPVYNTYFARGQVTMLYFAYLKRDPDLNDPNLLGWTEWVFVFDNGGAQRGRPDILPRDIHHLIFGFIYSEEYRKRFGQP